MASPHTIQKQFLHVELIGTEAQAFALQNQLSALCYDSLFLSLEQVFNRINQTDITWCIERLDIDAGTFALNRLKEDLAEIVAGEIDKQLQAYVLKNDVRHDSQSLMVERKTRQQTTGEAFFYFLTTGRLPWSFSLPNGETLESQLLDSWQRDGGITFFSQSSFCDLLETPQVRNRLTSQFSVNFLTKLLERINPESEKVVRSLSAVIDRADFPKSEINEFNRQLWDTIFLQISQGKVLTEQDLVDKVLKSLTASLTAPSKFIVKLERLWSGTASESKVGIAVLDKLPSGQMPQVASILKTLSDSGLESEILHIIEQELLKVSVANTDDPPLSEQELVSSVWHALPLSLKQPELINIIRHKWPDAIALIDPQESFSPDLKNDLNQYRQNISDTSDDIKQGIYITNAGLVLLHPFLSQLFTALNIVSDNILIQPNRALGLLHFLATGRLESPEYELVLPKLLCGLPVESPVDSSFALTQEEIDEAEVLLQAVVKHWEVLKNTGIDGLRGTFLLRSGKLSQREDGDWFLQVENKGFDILMAQLPWGIGMIKLPWMQRMLWVEWQT